MARLFDGTNDSLQASVDLSAFSTATLAFWMYWDSFANDDDLAFEFTANYNLNDGGFVVDPNGGTGGGGGNFEVGCRLGNVHAVYFTRPSGAAWHHYLIHFDGTVTSHVALVRVDGTSQTLTNFVDLGGSGSLANSTLNFMCRNNASLFGAGRMAEVAFWGGVLLGADEAAALTDGTVPTLIRPDALANYWPLWGRASPEQELVGRAEATVNGAVFTDHPRVVYPSRRRVVYIPAAAPAGDAVPQVWAQYRRRFAG